MTAELGTTSRAIETCQVCDSSDLASVLFLGHVRPGNMMDPVGVPLREQTFYPLELLRCDRCTLVQIGTVVDPEVIFPKDFPYRTRMTRALVENFADLARETRPFLRPGELVIDVGSNDGTLLKNYQPAQQVLGIEPSGAARDAEAAGLPTKMAFMGPHIVDDILAEVGRAKIVTCTNTFAHMPDVRGVLRSIVDVMTDDGIFISESHYLGDLVADLQYDTIYHEHLRYYSVRSLGFLLASAGLEIFRVTRIGTHGGSIRVYAARSGRYDVEPVVTDILREEDTGGLSDGTALENFAERVRRSKLDLLSLLAKVMGTGGYLYGIGAAVRACTLISYVGLDESILDCVVEVSSSQKIGHYIPGTRIPVLDEKELLRNQPRHALLLSWHVAQHVAENLRGRGYQGAFITPLPSPAILDI